MDALARGLTYVLAASIPLSLAACSETFGELVRQAILQRRKRAPGPRINAGNFLLL